MRTWGNMTTNGEVKLNGDAATGMLKTSEEDFILTSVVPGVLATQSINPSWSVEAVVATIPGGAPQTDSTSPVPFFHMLERLKTTKREGWRRFGISQ